jgi:uncharacterized protein
MRRAIITGASSGIGRALAQLLASEKLQLFLTGRDPVALKQISEECGAQMCLADLQLEEGRERVKGAILQFQPDLLINNAGFGIYGPAIATSIEAQSAILEVNARAALEITLAAAHFFLKAKKTGIILNVSSVAGEFPTPGMSVYGASKAFLTQLSRALNFELKPYGIAVLVACPGSVKTDFVRRASGREEEGGHLMSPEKVAKAIWKKILGRKEKKIIDAYYCFVTGLAACFPKILVKKAIWKRKRQ